MQGSPIIENVRNDLPHHFVLQKVSVSTEVDRRSGSADSGHRPRRREADEALSPGLAAGTEIKVFGTAYEANWESGLVVVGGELMTSARYPKS